ncbi:MAG: nucleotide sugar dehydrogenase, partial [Patescibacteria group bacterium]|nr:nucleotide sugar dehydrogenase [Patescibacteria group bacterium]
MVPKQFEKLNLAVVGLGYVGLPLAIEFAKTGVKVIGFDINTKRITELNKGIDSSGEIENEEIQETNIDYTSEPQKLKKTNFIIMALPTPVNQANQPDLSLVENASRLVGQNLSKNATVIYESTVYPGVTEDICVPIIEKESGLKCGRDWFIGYSPERVNPGDKEHTISKIVKIVSGMDKKTLKKIAEVYGAICKDGVHLAPSIKIAEAAKVFENIQRDVNIALMNELSLICHRLNINTQDVLEAAGTKWNFLKFRPGLVGGHCVGVDPYYLAYKAEELGYHPQVILAGRRINNYMAEFVALETIEGLIEAGKAVRGAKVLIMGLTFKENIRDMRNSKITVVINKLKELGVKVIGFDPNL